MTALTDLAAAAGVATHWNNYRNDPQEVSEEALRRVLGALGLPAKSPAQIRESRARLAEQQEGLPPLVTTVEGEPTPLPLQRGPFELVFEDGTKLYGKTTEHAGGALLQAIEVPGYHVLETAGRQTTLAVAPRRGFTVPEAARPWALAVQMYSLRRPGDAGLGDFRALEDFVQHAAAHGAAGVAISPVHAQFSADPDRFSPYSPSSRIMLNVLHAGLDWPQDAETARLEAEPLVDWPTASRRRLAALRAAFTAASPAEREALEAFRKREGEPLETHARFEAIHAEQLRAGRWHWRTWPEALRDPASPAVAAFAAAHQDEVALHAYMQFLADRSLANAQASARQAGMRIGLIADLAVGADSGGSHCWSRQKETLIGFAIGAPPDLLSTNGQNWGLAAFSPFGLRQNGFAAYLEMLRAAMRHAGGVRIDHALGLRRLWIVPDGVEAREGAYLAFPQADMLRLIALEIIAKPLDRARRGSRHDPRGVPGRAGRRRHPRHARALVRTGRPKLHPAAHLVARRRGDDQHARSADTGGLVGRARPRVARQAGPRRRAGAAGAGRQRALPRPLRALGHDARQRRGARRASAR